ncbi:polysaccharide deacetylase family protein [Brevibacillus laterosporus]|uniref:polysaccharide deacetylase family protein n=1 Tax=Brevibacillus laterosporus TaxID=1465 RepID=UPI000E6BABF9|nr:polysaccharide deacetylase family protein [Brevibacillus laterosporus]AYB38576.1 polysaccharide deacetylase family protein [Brevibacillus laterosporus]MBG9772049.1 chitooligosaccharide deacetylase [Brevibacillus laterosporus]MBM7110762.1 Peptidoglycan-N-acetylglucosamine deacetylase [Brevibacillus laterosporus]NKQ18379.1 polysaccharide deacetylase family protein [Brevibacillus laterosporus]WNX33147.1 polysaccharide deacetylase family protein [Brevibacillus laterosporus]
MKVIWIIPLLVLMIFSGCTQSKNNTLPPKSEGINNSAIQSSRTPNLTDGSEGETRNPHPLTLADLREKYKSTFLLRGSASKREVALTFDDAPDDCFTPQILDILKQEGVRATFFVVGNRIEAHPEIVQRMVKEGHILGNHSYNHPNFPTLSDADFRDQVIRTDELISSFTGYKPSFIRAPYGNINEDQILWLASQHKKIINWDVDSLDWKGLSTEQVKTNILAHVHPGSIVLQHAGGGIGEDLSGTVHALPEIIKKLRNDGVKLVTIPELLDLPAG